MKKTAIIGLLVIGGLFALTFFVTSQKEMPGQSFGAGWQQVAATNLLGTQAVKMGLSTSTLPFPGAIYPTKGYDKVFFTSVYTPRATDAYARVLFECSIDDGSSYFFLPTRSPSTAEVLVYADSGTGQSTTSGIPFIIPGDKTTTSGVAVTSTLAEFENTACTHYRVSAGETSTGASGTIWIQAGGKVSQ